MEIAKPNLSFDQWRSKFIRTYYAIVAVIFVVEVIVFFVFLPFGLLDEGSNKLRYAKEYIGIPTALNLIIVSACYVINKSSMPSLQKNYALVFSFSALVTVIAFVHHAATAILTSFGIPIFITILFGSKKMTKSVTLVNCALLLAASVRGALLHADLIFCFNVVVAFTILFSAYLISSVLIAYNKANSDYIFYSYKNQVSLSEAAQNDSLTGLFNQKAFHNLLNISMDKAKKTKSPMALAIIDIDFFKDINDTHGHLAGDEVIIHFTKLIKQQCDNNKAYVSRYGGDEFAVIFPNASKEMAYLKLEGIRKRCAFPVPSKPEITQISFSAGVSHYVEGALTEKELFEQADTALYHAKENGKGQTSMFPC